MSRKKKSVLIVDDEFASRRLLGHILRNNFSCEITEAQDGSEALQLMLRNDFDIVFLDMLMPFMNGVQVLKTMKKNARLSEILVVACTSIDDNAMVKEIIALDVEQYIVKPLVKDAVVEKVSPLLSIKQK